MSLRTKFGDQGCKRFGDDKESVASTDKKMKRIVNEGSKELMDIVDDVTADLLRENKALRQQVAELTLQLAGNKKGVTKKIGVTNDENDVTKISERKRGPKPTLTPEEKKRKTAARVKAWRSRNP